MLAPSPCIFSSEYSCGALLSLVLPLRPISSGSKRKTIHKTASIHLSSSYTSSLSPHILYCNNYKRVTNFTQPCVWFCAFSLSLSLIVCIDPVNSVTTPGEVSTVYPSSFFPLHIVNHSVTVDSKPERTSQWKQPTAGRGINTKVGNTVL